MIAFITCSNFYELPGFREESIETRSGRVALLRREIDYRANLLGLREVGATAAETLPARVADCSFENFVYRFE